MTASVFLVIFYAPVEKTMGAIQKIFYFHVAAGWVGMLGFLTAATAGGFYLARERAGQGGTAGRWDAAALAGVQIGLGFTAFCVASGMVWAKQTWGTWWTWDPRLTTTAIMLLIYAAYLLLRQGIEDEGMRRRFAAVYAIAGFVSVPLTFISIRLFRTVHPVVIGTSDPGALGAFNMDGRMQVAFFFTLGAFTVLYAALLWWRVGRKT